MPRHRVTIAGRDYAAMADLGRRYRIAVVRQTAKAVPEGGYTVQAFVEPDQLRTLEAAGYRVDRHEDAEAGGRQRQSEVAAARARRGTAAREPDGGAHRVLRAGPSLNGRRGGMASLGGVPS